MAPAEPLAAPRAGSWRRACALAVLLWPALAAAAPTLEAVDRAVRARDYVRAVELLSALAGGGDAEAQYRLGGLYRAGRGVEVSHDAAARWFGRAAAQGHADAQYNLGVMFEKGWGVEQDLGLARRWFNEAAEQGHERARQRLPKLANAAPATRPRSEPAPVLDREQRETALRRAAAAGEREAVERLLGAETAIDAADDYGRTAAIEAATAGQAEVLDLLIRRGADFNRSDRYGDNALLLAAGKGHTGVVDLLLSHGARIESRDRYGNTPLLAATLGGHKATLRSLIRRGANPAAVNRDGQGALELANAGDKQLLAMLARAGAPKRRSGPSAADKRKQVGQRAARLERPAEDPVYADWQPLMLAAWRRQSDLVKELIRRGEPVNFTDREGHTPLSRAAARGDRESVAALLAAGAEVNPGAAAQSPLYWAVQGGHQAVAERLLAARADPNRRPAGRTPALVLAARAGQAGLVARLLQGGAQVDDLDAAGSSALQWAVRESRPRTAGVLLKAGADANHRDRDGRTALDYAIINDNPELLRSLQQAGAGHRVGAGGQSALHLAAINGSTAVIGDVISAGVPIDGRDLKGNTPLMLAAGRGQAAVLGVLMERKAKLDLVNREGNTALMLAIANQQVETARLLLAGGADPRIRNHNRENARSLANASGNQRLLEALKEAGGGRWFGLF